MQKVTTIAALRALVGDWRQNRQSIAFVPTMGNLHAGHIALVENARRHADRVVVSIFVNPAQFGPNEDFDSYPRTERQDQEKLITGGADLLFLPGIDEIYPRSAQTRISVSGLSDLYCGASRPGHFDGVALVVCKLLNMVQPDLLLMGEKDYQQLAIIRTLVTDLNIPVQVLGVATVRESDGLAMSSRNSYLSVAERETAPKLYQALCSIRDAIAAGNKDFRSLIERQAQSLSESGFVIDYFDVCRSSDLLPATADDKQLRILLAAKLGTTRLIDNIQTNL
jgi:pantoate--beta-alanine ligase